jgi:hypothetical protein
MPKRELLQRVREAQNIYFNVLREAEIEFLKKEAKFKEGDVVKRSPKGRVKYRIKSIGVLYGQCRIIPDDPLSVPVTIVYYAYDVRILPANIQECWERYSVELWQTEDMVKVEG